MLVCHYYPSIKGDNCSLTFSSGKTLRHCYCNCWKPNSSFQKLYCGRWSIRGRVTVIGTIPSVITITCFSEVFGLTVTCNRHGNASSSCVLSRLSKILWSGIRQLQMIDKVPQCYPLVVRWVHVGSKHMMINLTQVAPLMLTSLPL